MNAPRTEMSGEHFVAMCYFSSVSKIFYAISTPFLLHFRGEIYRIV